MLDISHFDVKIGGLGKIGGLVFGVMFRSFGGVIVILRRKIFVLC